MALPALWGIEFAVWLTLIGSLIFIILCVAIAQSLFGFGEGTLGKLPVIGGWINGKLHTIEHKIVGTMSGWAASVEALCGAVWHEMAREVDWLGREIKTHIGLIAGLAAFMIGTAPLDLLRLLIGELRKLIHGTHKTATAALSHSVTAGRIARHTVTTDVFPRLRTAEREIGHIATWDIPHLWKRTRTIQAEIDRLFEWSKAHTLQAGTLAFAGAVGLALSRLGLGWTRCDRVGKLGKAACGMNPNLLESLLVGALVVASPISIVELTKACQEIESTCEDGLRYFIRELPKAV